MHESMEGRLTKNDQMLKQLWAEQEARGMKQALVRVDAMNDK